MIRRYVHGPGLDEPLVMSQREDVTGLYHTFYALADERGSVLGLWDDSISALVKVNAYDEFGSPSSDNISLFAYVGNDPVNKVEPWCLADPVWVPAKALVVTSCRTLCFGRKLSQPYPGHRHGRRHGHRHGHQRPAE